MSESTWKRVLEGKIREDWGREIDVFETQIELRKKSKVEEKLFAEARLRRGVYGQRYDNGQRHDGEKTQTLTFPTGDLTKGPSTAWDAPGMMRIKLPMGRVSSQQLEVMCELAEEYSDQILHVTTRQDIQLHFVHIEDTPNLMRRLASVGITTREACGNSVRNITACPLVGVCNDESFDVSPYANAMMYFLLGHDDVQNFGRKFKIAFSGCKTNPCGLVNFHDLGCIAATRTVNGEVKRGFEVYVGGGLGSVPQNAQLLDEFCPEEELFPLTQAVCRVFARLGEKENRSRARIKFLVKKLGIEEFKRLTLEERAKLRPDERWTNFLDNLAITEEKPLKPPSKLPAGPHSAEFEAWRRTNVQPQRQQGYSVATVTLPLGDFTPDQGRAIADIARRYTGDAMRATVDQNWLFRWVSDGDLVKLHAELAAIGLGEPGSDRIGDVTSCPGTDTCKLGISSSRGLAGELRKRLAVEQPEAVDKLHIKCSGCFNSCGQHHVADLGFLGVSRAVNNRRVPHFQLVVGGQLQNNGGSYGLALGAIPSKRVPDAVSRLTKAYNERRQGEESFKAFVERVGKKDIKSLIEDLSHVPPYEQDPSYYSDWGDPREYTIGDIGVGECAGEVVSFVQFGLQKSELEVFEAQVLLDEGKNDDAASRAYRAMLEAARALAKEKNANLGEEPEEIIREFKQHWVETKLFWDPFAGAKFAQYLFKAHEEAGGKTHSKESAHQLVEEAQLFVDAAHQAHTRIGTALP